MPVAWFITHEEHEDARNICILQSLIDLGYSVTDFSAMKGWGGDISGLQRIQSPELDPAQVVFGSLADFPRPEVAELVSALRNRLLADPAVAGKPIVSGMIDERMRFTQFRHAATEGSAEVGFLCVSGNGGFACLDLMTKALFLAPYPVFCFAPTGLIAVADHLPLDQYYVFDTRSNRLVRHAYVTPVEVKGHGIFDFSEFSSHVSNNSKIFGRVLSWHQSSGQVPDLVVVADSLALPVGLVAKAAFGARLVVDCHEWYGKDILANSPLPSREQDAAVADRFEAQAYPACDARATVGRHIGNEMAAHFGCDFPVLYHCISPDEDAGALQREDGFWERVAGLPAGTRVALFVGAVSTMRNLDTLVRAARHLADDQAIVMVGGGSYRAELEAIARSEGVADKVRFLGHVPGAEVPRYVANGHVGVIPYHAFDDYVRLYTPNKLAYYYGARVPIVADQGMAEICDLVLGDDTGCCIDVTDAEIFGTTLRRMMGDAELIDRFQKGFERAPQRFTYAAFRDGIAALVGR